LPPHKRREIKEKSKNHPDQMKESTGAAETGKKNIHGSMTLVTDKKIKAGRWRTLCPPHHRERAIDTDK
jgi:hypothetical protein